MGLTGPSLNGASDGRISFGTDCRLTCGSHSPMTIPGPLSLSGYRPTAQDGETNAYNRAAFFLFSRRQLPIIIWYLLFVFSSSSCQNNMRAITKASESSGINPLRRRLCVFDLIDINHWTEVFLRTMVVGFKLWGGTWNERAVIFCL